MSYRHVLDMFPLRCLSSTHTQTHDHAGPQSLLQIHAAAAGSTFNYLSGTLLLLLLSLVLSPSAKDKRATLFLPLSVFVGLFVPLTIFTNR